MTNETKIGVETEEVMLEEKLLNANETPDVGEPTDNIPDEKKPKGIIIDDIEQQAQIEYMESLNYIEIYQFKRDLQKEMKDMKFLKESIDSLRGIQKSIVNEQNKFSKKLGKSIAIANMAEDIGLDDEEMKVFEENYDNNISKMTDLHELVINRIKEFDDVKKTSSYMNQAMVEMLDKKIMNLGGCVDKRVKKLKFFYQNMRKIYSERDSLTFIRDAVSPNMIYLKRLVNDLKKDKKNGGNGRKLTSGIQTQVSHTFCSIFTPNQMIAFEKHLKSIFEETDKSYDSFIFQYFLYIIYINETKKYRGYHKWVEALIINILDMKESRYDLPKSEEEYNKELIEIKNTIMSQLPSL